MKNAISTDTGVLGALVGFGILAGGAFMFVKVLVGELSPLQLVAARTAMASAGVLGVMAMARTTVPFTRRYWRGAAELTALDCVVPYLLIAWAQTHVSSSTAALLVATMPLFTTLFASAAGETQSVTLMSSGGIVLGFTGAAVLAGPSALSMSDSSSAGMLAIVLSAACYAAAAVRARPMLREANPLALTGAKLVLATAIVAPPALIFDGAGGYTSMSTEAVLCLVVLGLGSTGVGRCLYLWAIGRAGSVKASMVTYIAPGIAIGLGWLVLDEALDARMGAGAALIIAGVATTMFGPKLRLRLLARPATEALSVAARAGS